MNRRRFLASLALGLAATTITLAAPPVKKWQGVPVLITEKGGKTKSGVAIAQNAFEPRDPNPTVHFDTDSGSVEVSLNELVSISAVKETPGRKTSALFFFKDQSQKRLQFGFCQECLWIQTRDGKKEKIDLKRITRVEFKDY